MEQGSHGMKTVGLWVAVVLVSALAGAGAATVVTQKMAQTPTSVSSSDTGVTTTAAPVSTDVTNVNISDGITQVVKKTSGAVFPVLNYQTSSQYSFGGFGSGYGGGSDGSGQDQEEAVGTSVLFKKDSSNAYLVTNNHVIEGANKVEIVTASGKHITAQIVGADPYTDLAVLKVSASAVANITPLSFANSDDIEIGEPVVAIGTPEGLEFQDSVTSGIVSGNQRIMPVQDPNTQETLNYQSVIQTDAAINPGNSGGPLLDLQGDVIGINSSKIVDPSVQGMGFAIPSNTVITIVNQILQTGHAVHPAIGIEGYELDTVPQSYWPNVPVNYGIYVRTVTSSQAQAAGIKAGDVIVGINGTTVRTLADLREVLFKLSPGQTVQVQLYRGSKKMTVTEKIGTLQPSSSYEN